MMHKWTFKGSGCFNMKIEDWKPIFNDEMHVKNGFLSLKQVIIIFFLKKIIKKMHKWVSRSCNFCIFITKSLRKLI